ncbi:non-ribosomal peptide synthetase component F, partial [Nocardia pseudobrasiliensis]
PSYNIPLAIRLSGALDVDALRRAVADVVERHEVLRTRYPAGGPGGLPYQEILSASEALPDGLVVETTVDPMGRITELMSTGFDVTAAPPVRLRVIRLTESEHVLGLVVHHIAGDGASMAPLARDLVTAYVARSQGGDPGWAPLEVQYADFAIWQRGVIGSDDDENSVAARQLAYWREQLAGLSTGPVLPLDRPRPSVPSMRGGGVGFLVPRAVHEGLVRVAREHNSSLFMVVHAALAVLLARQSGSADIVVGTPIAGRGERALDDLVGMFVNTLALRTAVSTSDTFDALVEKVREADLSAFANADIPFERVVEVVSPGRSGAQSLFQVVLSFQNTEQPSLELPGLTIAGLDTDAVAAKFDLQVTVEPQHEADGTPGELITVLTYATDLFDESSVQALGRRFERILTAVAADPQILVGAIDLLDEQEHRIESDRSESAELATTVGTALAQALGAAVDDDPDGPALAFGDKAITYHELDARSSRLARVLIARDCGPGVGVALRLGRGVEAAVATWAVLKAGAAMVPLADGVALPTTVEFKVGLADSATGEPGGIDWLALDDPSVVAEIAGQSARPVTYATRTRALRGPDPAFAAAETVLSYDALAAVVDRVRSRTELTFESRTFRQGRADSVAGVLEIVAAGAAGASLVVPAELGSEALADEWVTHLFIDGVGLAGLDPAPLEDLRAVVIESGTIPANGFGVAEVVLTLEELAEVRGEGLG